MNTYTYIYIFIHPEVPKSTYKLGASSDFWLPSPVFKTTKKKRLAVVAPSRHEAARECRWHWPRPPTRSRRRGCLFRAPKNWPLKVSKPAF